MHKTADQKWNNEKLIFEEQQKMGQWWLWLILIAITLIPLYGVYQQIYLDRPFGDHPLPNAGLITFLVVMLGILLFFGKLQLVTKITNEKMWFRLVPFYTVEVKWKDVDMAEVIDYGFVGGWGIRLGTKYGTVYNTSGSIGLAIQLKSGRKLCVGTHKREELSKVIQTLRSDHHIKSNSTLRPTS